MGVFGNFLLWIAARLLLLLRFIIMTFPRPQATNSCINSTVNVDSLLMPRPLLILSVVHLTNILNFMFPPTLDMEHPEIPPVLPTSDAPKQSPEVEPLTPPSRQDQRKFMKLLKKSPVLPEAIQPILSLYNFEILHNQQSPDVLDEVEKLLGYVNWPWWNYADRAYLINYKVTSILYRLLYLHGFAFHPYFLGFLMAPRLC